MCIRDRYWFVNAGSFVVLGFASFVTARRARSHGLFYGLAIGGIYAVLTALIGAIASVSYTHLDVYKRQDVHRRSV